MNLYDILEMLGLEHAINYAELSPEQEERLYESLEVHQQPSYPLKGSVANVRMMDGKPVIALNEAYEYGSKEAWEEGYE